MPNITLMGWNQIVAIGPSDGATRQYKVADYSVGINQNFKVEKMVSGATDKMTWARQKIEVQGRIKMPFLESTGGMFLWYACQAATPDAASYMQLNSTIHPSVNNALVQSYEVKADAENPITLDVEVWGVNASTQGIDLNSGVGHTNNASDKAPVLSDVVGDPDGIGLAGSGSGSVSLNPADIYEEEIPMFDKITGVKELLPVNNGNTIYGLPTSFSFKIMNNLQRNYILGESLDAWSVSSGQRDLTGSVSWISNVSGNISHIRNTGLTGGGIIDIAGVLTIDLGNAYLIWSATPPTLNTEKISVSSNFQMIAKTAELIDLGAVAPS